jgi:hypothetical protein
MGNFLYDGKFPIRKLEASRQEKSLDLTGKSVQPLARRDL